MEIGGLNCSGVSVDVDRWWFGIAGGGILGFFGGGIVGLLVWECFLFIVVDFCGGLWGGFFGGGGFLGCVFGLVCFWFGTVFFGEVFICFGYVCDWAVGVFVWVVIVMLYGRFGRFGRFGGGGVGFLGIFFWIFEILVLEKNKINKCIIGKNKIVKGIDVEILKIFLYVSIY